MADTTIQHLQSEINKTNESLRQILVVDDSGVSAPDLRAAYADDLINKGNDAKANRILSITGQNPVSNHIEIKGDSEPILSDVNGALNDVSIDVLILDNQLINTTAKYVDLIRGSMERMNEAQKRILTERQRIDDINMICSTYKQLSNIRTLTIDDFSGQCTYDEGTNTFSAYSDEMENPELSVVSVDGNGYIGNFFVYQKDGTFANENINTSDTGNLVDNSSMTTFEYSRLCSSKDLPYSMVNHDDKPAACTIEFSSGNNLVNAVKINTDSNDLVVKDVLISEDNGATYHSAFTSSKKLGADIYSNYDYVCNSNIIGFPKTNFFKLVLQSDMSYGSEQIAYNGTDIEDGVPIPKTTVLKDVRRKVISINGITAYMASYQDSVLLTGQLVTGNELKSIAIFANQYIPDYFKDEQYIRYVLILNGEEYEVRPINSDESGIKLICYREYQYMSPGVMYLSETIKSAQLRIEITTPDATATPFLANLKICTGE